MRRFKNILVVYGDSPGADDVLSHATALAKANSARLAIIEALPEYSATTTALAERRKRLERLVPSVLSEGVETVTVDAVSGTPFLRIIERVFREGHDLVIAGAEGALTLRRFTFGSTATHLMRKCPCPVWIVNPGQAQTYSSILACIDPGRGRTEGDMMDRKIIDLASSMAAAHGAALHVVHAWEVEGKDRDTISSEIRDDARLAIMAKHEARQRGRVEAILSDYDLTGIRHRLHLPNGPAQGAILDLVDAENVDLIVMGTVCRTGISGLIIGNAAETILSAVECGVLTVKPPGFVSPVVLDKERMSA